MTNKEYKKSLQPDKDLQQRIIKINAYLMAKRGEITETQRDHVIANLSDMWIYWRGCWNPYRSARYAIREFLGMPKENQTRSRS